MYTSSTHEYARNIGLASSLVQTLKDYGKPLPVGYLARVHGRTQSKIKLYLDKLEKECLIEQYEDKNNTTYVKLHPSI